MRYIIAFAFVFALPAAVLAEDRPANQNVERLVQSARTLHDRGRYEAAERRLLAALREDPGNPEAAELLAEVHTALRDARQNLLDRVREHERETALRMLDDAWTVPRGVITYPPDWEERARQSRQEAADAVANIEEGERTRQARTTLQDEEGSIDVRDEELAAVATHIRELSGLNVVVDPAVEDKTLTLTVDDITLEDMLDWVTRQTDTDWALRNGVVYIGPPEKVRPEAVTQLYDISDILHTERLLRREPERPVAAPLIPPPRRRVLFDERYDPDRYWDVEEETLDEIAAEFIEFIKEATGRELWEEDGHRNASVYLRRLILKAEPEVHQRVLELIEEMED